MRFVDIQRELCIRPGKNIDETLKSPLLQEKGYVTANPYRNKTHLRAHLGIRSGLTRAYVVYPTREQCTKSD